MRLREFDEKEQLLKANEKLTKYKTAAGANAAAADAAGNFARGNTRFKGINRATKKQFANDANLAKLKEFADQGVAEGSLNEFAPGGEDGNSPYAYGMAILGYAEDYKQIHGKSSSTNDDVADISEIGNTFLNKGMAAGIAALFSVDTFVSDSIVADLAEQGFNVMADLIDKRPRSAQWHQQVAAGQQALADYEASRKKSSEETDSSKAVDTLARVLKSSLQDYQAAAGDKNKLKQLGLLIGLSDNHRTAIHHALQQIQQNDFDGAIKSLVATPPGASGPGYDALDYGYSKQKAGVSVQQLIQFIRKHFELSEQGVAEGSEQKPAITYKDYTLQYDYQTEDDDPEGYSTATTYYFDVLKDGDRVGEAEYFDYFGNLTIRINGKTKEFEFRHPLASQISQLVSSLPDDQKKDLSDPRFESQGVAEGWSQKYKKSINCSHPKGFSQKAHCAGKQKHNESIEMEMVCEDCGMCQSHGSLNEIAKGAKDANSVTKCWPGKHAEGTKTGKNGGQVRNCVPNESVEEAKHGLYYNVNKRKAAGTSRPASSPKAPTAQAWKDAAKTAQKEDVAEDQLDELSKDTLKNYVRAQPARIKGPAGLATTDNQKAARIVDPVTGDIRRAMNKYKDPEYGQQKPRLPEDSLAAMRRLAGVTTPLPAAVPNGLRQYRHMPTAVQPR